MGLYRRSVNDFIFHHNSFLLINKFILYLIDVMNIVSVAYGIIFVVILIAGLLIAYVIYKRRKNL